MKRKKNWIAKAACVVSKFHISGLQIPYLRTAEGLLFSGFLPNFTFFLVSETNMDSSSYASSVIYAPDLDRSSSPDQTIWTTNFINIMFRQPACWASLIGIIGRIIGRIGIVISHEAGNAKDPNNFCFKQKILFISQTLQINQYDGKLINSLVYNGNSHYFQISLCWWTRTL